jgi:hypothetical protein
MAKVKKKVKQKKKVLRYFRYRQMLQDKHGRYGWIKGTCEVVVYEGTGAQQEAQGKKKVQEHLKGLYGKALVEDPEEVVKGQLLESCRPNTNRIEMV